MCHYSDVNLLRSSSYYQSTAEDTYNAFHVICVVFLNADTSRPFTVVYIYLIFFQIYHLIEITEAQYLLFFSYKSLHLIYLKCLILMCFALVSHYHPLQEETFVTACDWTIDQWHLSKQEYMLTMAGTQAVKAYLDLLSQPCRALLIFLKHNKIPHTVELVALRKGEQQCCCEWEVVQCAFVKSKDCTKVT